MTTHHLTVTAPEGQATIEFAREFDAPVEAVFAAHCGPDLVRQWLGPHGYEMQIEEYDFRSGGRWRCLHRNPQGQEFGFHGCFQTVRESELAVQTVEYEGAPDHVSLDALHFERLDDGRTRLRGRSAFGSAQARDAMIASGMEGCMEGCMQEGYERLDALVARVPSAAGA